MLKEIINLVMDAFARFKGVRTVKYQTDYLNNQQHNYDTIQVYIDDNVYQQFNITTNTVKAEMNVYIVGFPDNQTPENILEVQNNCYEVAINVLSLLDIGTAYKGVLNVHDYSILTFSHYTSQQNAGVKLSLELEIPNPVNICELDEHFGEPYVPDDDTLDIDTDNEVGELTITPIKLPSNPCR